MEPFAGSRGSYPDQNPFASVRCEGKTCPEVIRWTGLAKKRHESQNLIFGASDASLGTEVASFPKLRG